MKKILVLTLGLALTVVSCKENNASSQINQDNVAAAAGAITNGEYPVIKFDRTTHDFGSILNNEAVTTEFEITNTGKADLIIINASASCGCTVPEYQKTPIKPGETSKITVKFQTGAEGQQQKTVTLVTNTEKAEEVLTIKANVGLRSN